MKQAGYGRSSADTLECDAPAAAICAVMVTYNGGEVVARAAEAVIRQVGRLLIIDNHSDAATLECVAGIRARFPDNVAAILNPHNAGIAAALNQGVEFAARNGFRWVLTLDQDSQADGRMVGEMLRAYEAYPQKDDIAILAPRYVLHADGDEGDGVGAEAGRRPFQVEMTYTSGSLVRTAVFERVGRFREEFFIDHVDSDFCHRLNRSGYKIVVAPDALLSHRLGNMRRARFMGRKVFCAHYPPSRHYYRTRNGLVLQKELKDWRQARRFAVSTIKDVVKILIYEKQKGRKLRLIARAIRDGLRGHLGELE